MKTLLKPVLLLATAGSFLLWAVNVLYALQKLTGLPALSFAGLEAADVPYPARVDLSTVTPLVLAMTLIAVTRGLGRIHRWEEKGGKPEELWGPGFPFSHGFRNLLIQLGLLGTIFAFIVAFDNMAQTTQTGAAAAPTYDPSILIAPLGTALWSTFAGIAMAFLVLPPIEALFRRAMGVRGQGAAQGEVDALGRSLADLEERIRQSTGALGRMAGQVKIVGDGLDRLQAAERAALLAEGLRDAIGRLDGAARELRPALEGTQAALAVFPQPVRQAAELVVSIQGELALQRQTVGRLTESLTATARVAAVFADPRSGLGGIVAGLEGAGSGLRGLADAVRENAAAPRWPALDGSPLGRELTALRAHLVRVDERLEMLSRQTRAALAGAPAPRPGLLAVLRDRLLRGRRAA